MEFICLNTYFQYYSYVDLEIIFILEHYEIGEILI